MWRTYVDYCYICLIRLTDIIMKHFLHIIVLLSLFAASACDPVEQQPQQEDKISLSSKEAKIDYQEQILKITVTSSGIWTLTGSYDWAVPSVKTGKTEILFQLP